MIFMQLISCCILKTVQDSAIVTMEGNWEITNGLLNLVIARRP